MDKAICHVTRREFSLDELVKFDEIRPSTINEIRKDYPDFAEGCYISYQQLYKYRHRYLERLMEVEVGEVTDLEKDVVEALSKNKLVADNIEPDIEEKLSVGDKLADKIADFGGSWKFIILFSSIIMIWIIFNVYILHNHSFDPYPFILLNLVLSCIAALQAPVIMMSQNRQEAKDRTRSEHDYQVNLAAELQIRLLHEKIDHIMINQFRNIVEIQEIQIKSLDELQSRLNNHLNKKEQGDS